MNNKLFLSYGHREQTICLKICETLRQHGYDVWMDQSDIKEGDDWRRKIFEGISHSNGIIACLSKHSCRNPGVCLNELSIAVGIKGGNIKTILLEAEEEVVAPAELCHSQWLDMHDWREWEDQGEEKFEEWFSMKMKSLLEMIEREGEFVGEIESIRKILDPNISRSRQGALLAKSFWGRRWLTEQVEAWLRDENGSRMMLLYGEPGIGKSAFAANYIHYNAKVVGGIFCERNNIHFNTPENVIRTIAFQLACRLPAYRKVLVQIITSEDYLLEYNASELFDLLLAYPLKDLYIDGHHETLCFVIDGLDECGDEKENVLARTLKRYGDRLPHWLRFLITSREVSSVTSTFGTTESLRLQGGMLENMEDVKSYYQSCLMEELKKIDSKKEREEILNRLSEASKGIFLYAELMANSIHNGKQSIRDTEHFPEGLSEMFYQWFEGSFPDKSLFEHKYRDFISLMLAIPEGIPVEEMSFLLDINENQKHDLFLKMGVLLAANKNWLGGQTWVFSHQYISEWIRSEEAGRFYCSPDAGMDVLNKYLRHQYENASDEMTPWEIFCLIEQMGNEKQAKRSAKLLEDRTFLENAMAMGDTFVEAEEVYKARVCYGLLKVMLDGCNSIIEESLSKKDQRTVLNLKEGIQNRFDILNEVFLSGKNNKDKNMKQLMDESQTAEAVEMVRKSLHLSVADRVADSLLFQTFEEQRARVKNGIRNLAVQERHRKQLRGPILTWPMALIVGVLMIASLYFIYTDYQNDPFWSEYAVSGIMNRLIRVGLGCAIVAGGLWLYKTDFAAVGKKLSKSIRSFILGGLAGALLAANRSLTYLPLLLIAIWPVIAIALATALLYKEETYELVSKKSHPILWSALYYGIVILLINIFNYNPYPWIDYMDQINWIYMVLVADTAYLLFAKPRTEELIQFSRRMNNQSLFDTKQEEGLSQQEIAKKARGKMPVRIIMTVLFNILAIILLVIRSERVREILISIFNYELRGIDSWSNLGWISFRFDAVSKSIQGDYSALSNQSTVAQSLPLSWIHSQYGIIVLVLALFLVIALLVMMKRYIQEEIESEFVVSVQKLILFSFIFQTILGIIAELFFFTNTDIKIIFLGNTNSIILWILFMGIGKSRKGKRHKRKGESL